MLDDLDAFERTGDDLGRLVTNLMGLVRAADIHDEQVRSSYYDQWVKLDMGTSFERNHGPRSSSASDDRLAAGLRGVRGWVEELLADDDGELF